ncbi:hypothetical protein [Paenibacillus sp. RC67]|uniref:hypothetical protein n=1 Tax=Paenibacillus sp. RC67 TaxID=3039392 RepID=UPI0024ACA05F|nr:hypothetical protein [Paenibacillus sp. RC67]
MSEKNKENNEMPVGINAPLYQHDIASTDLISDAVEEMMDEIEEEFVDHKKDE